MKKSSSCPTFSSLLSSAQQSWGRSRSLSGFFWHGSHVTQTNSNSAFGEGVAAQRNVWSQGTAVLRGESLSFCSAWRSRIKERNLAQPSVSWFWQVTGARWGMGMSGWGRKDVLWNQTLFTLGKESSEHRINYYSWFWLRPVISLLLLQFKVSHCGDSPE